MTELMDHSILEPIAILGPDLTAVEWSERLKVPLSEVFAAFSILGTKPKPGREYTPQELYKKDQELEILTALDRGNHRVEDISKFVGLNPQSIRYKLRTMEHFGVVQRCGKGPYTRWVRK